MNYEINLILAGLVVLAILGGSCLAVSPDLLDRWALAMRARARGLRASSEAYRAAHDQSYIDDYRVAGERDEARRAFQELCSTERERIAE